MMENFVKEFTVGNIEIRLLLLEEIPDEAFEEMYGRCGKERREKIGRIRPEQKKRQSLGAGYLLYLLSRQFSIETEPVILPGGKPAFSEKEKVQFSISHSGAVVVLAFGEKPLGVDAEYIKPANLKLAKRFFTKEEYLYLLQLEGEKQKDGFCRIWTGKEAVVKAAGTGLSAPLDSFSVLGSTAELSGKKYELHQQKFTMGGNSLWISAAQLMTDIL